MDSWQEFHQMPAELILADPEVKTLDCFLPAVIIEVMIMHLLIQFLSVHFEPIVFC